MRILLSCFFSSSLLIPCQYLPSVKSSWLREKNFQHICLTTFGLFNCWKGYSTVFTKDICVQQMLGLMHGWDLELTITFILKNSCMPPKKSCSCELTITCEHCKKGWSSRQAADGRSAGFLWKHRWRKSFPSEDKVSGIVGDLFKTLNIAWT